MYCFILLFFIYDHYGSYLSIWVAWSCYIFLGRSWFFLPFFFALIHPLCIFKSSKRPFLRLELLRRVPSVTNSTQSPGWILIIWWRIKAELYVGVGVALTSWTDALPRHLLLSVDRLASPIYLMRIGVVRIRTHASQYFKLKSLLCLHQPFSISSYLMVLLHIRLSDLISIERNSSNSTDFNQKFLSVFGVPINILYLDPSSANTWEQFQVMTFFAYVGITDAPTIRILPGVCKSPPCVIDKAAYLNLTAAICYPPPAGPAYNIPGNMLIWRATLMQLRCIPLVLIVEDWNLIEFDLCMFSDLIYHLNINILRTSERPDSWKSWFRQML